MPDEAHEWQALAALMQRVVERDAAALETLYDRLAGRVFAQAARWLGGDVLAVEETVEETFWQVWRQAPRLLDAQEGLQDSLLQLARAAADEAARRRGPAPTPAARAATPGSPQGESPAFPQPLIQPGNQPFSGRPA